VRGMIRARWKCGRRPPISNYDINYEDLFVLDADIMPERQVLAKLLRYAQVFTGKSIREK